MKKSSGKGPENQTTYWTCRLAVGYYRESRAKARANIVQSGHDGCILRLSKSFALLRCNNENELLFYASESHIDMPCKSKIQTLLNE